MMRKKSPLLKIEKIDIVRIGVFGIQSPDEDYPGLQYQCKRFMVINSSSTGGKRYYESTSYHRFDNPNYMKKL